jgi:CheY-like chemotaxis protein
MTEAAVTLITQPPFLLVIEDSNEDFEAFQRYVRQATVKVLIYRCVDGDEALAFLFQTGRFAAPAAPAAPRPSLIVLDLNLPGADGREILSRIKQDDTLKTIPVVIFTTSNNPKDIEACYERGVNSYIVKPMDFQQLKQTITSLICYWFDTALLPTSILEHKR